LGAYAEIAQELPAETPERRRWVAIYAISSVEYGSTTYAFLKRFKGEDVSRLSLVEYDNFYVEDISTVGEQGAIRRSLCLMLLKE